MNHTMSLTEGNWNLSLEMQVQMRDAMNRATVEGSRARRSIPRAGMGCSRTGASIPAFGARFGVGDDQIMTCELPFHGGVVLLLLVTKRERRGERGKGEGAEHGATRIGGGAAARTQRSAARGEILIHPTGGSGTSWSLAWRREREEKGKTELAGNPRHNDLSYTSRGGRDGHLIQLQDINGEPLVRTGSDVGRRRCGGLDGLRSNR